MDRTFVLVTGACGYIGSHVTRQLSEQGYPVIAVDNLSTGYAGALLHHEHLYIEDIGNEAFLSELFMRHRFSAVLHFAGSIVVPESVAEPLRYYQNNTVNTLKLLRACGRAEVPHFVFSSTAAVYGDNLEPRLSESFPTQPTNPYSRSKLMSEWLLEDTARASKMRYVILRYFNVAGADPLIRMGQRCQHATHLIKLACETALGKHPSLTIYGEDYPTRDGTGIRDYIHVEDLSSAHLSALRYLQGGGSSVTLNCGYGYGVTVREVIQELVKVAGPFPVVAGGRRPGDVPSLIADTSAIRRTLDWQPKYASLSEIVRTAYLWEKSLSLQALPRNEGAGSQTTFATSRP